MSTSVYFELRNVDKGFGDKAVLKGADLTIRRGEVIVILGASGSGKSVTLRLFVGLERCDGGAVIVNGIDITRYSEQELYPIREDIGFLFQGGALFDSLTIYENIAYPLREHRQLDEIEIEHTVNQKLAMVELSDVKELYPSSLSGGMQKRAALARALALDPAAILYDEPTTGLDPPTADLINQQILNLNKKIGVTSVVVTHDIHCTLKVADRIALLSDGQFPVVLEKNEFVKSHHDVIREFLKASEVSYEQ